VEGIIKTTLHAKQALIAFLSIDLSARLFGKSNGTPRAGLDASTTSLTINIPHHEFRKKIL